MSRVDKISQQLKKAISRILLLEVKDSRIGFVTITQVRVSSDLKIAKVYYTLLEGNVKKKDAHEGLERASGYIRKLVAGRMKMRFTPEIKFYFDDTIEESIRIEKILDELKDEDRKQD
ncbi:MAG: 30S ribosome-binding factor RbfA [Candidatus Saelkia tenebricola]|nr:30S ribosome-binding factor RbfA [Candidatus Saelkia tenebricola]